MEAAAVRPQRQLVRLRGRSYVAFVFVPTVPIVDWLQEIDATIARSPGFFVGRPVVVDLSSVD
ncbi:MAG: septum formation inhibitor MinC, partial [Bradyrhizobium guangdongense]